MDYIIRTSVFFAVFARISSVNRLTRETFFFYEYSNDAKHPIFINHRMMVAHVIVHTKNYSTVYTFNENVCGGFCVFARCLWKDEKTKSKRASPFREHTYRCCVKQESPPNIEDHRVSGTF